MEQHTPCCQSCPGPMCFTPGSSQAKPFSKCWKYSHEQKRRICPSNQLGNTSLELKPRFHTPRSVSVSASACAGHLCRGHLCHGTGLLKHPAAFVTCAFSETGKHRRAKCTNTFPSLGLQSPGHAGRWTPSSSALSVKGFSIQA